MSFRATNGGSSYSSAGSGDSRERAPTTGKCPCFENPSRPSKPVRNPRNSARFLAQVDICNYGPATTQGDGRSDSNLSSARRTRGRTFDCGLSLSSRTKDVAPKSATRTGTSDQYCDNQCRVSRGPICSLSTHHTTRRTWTCRHWDGRSADSADARVGSSCRSGQMTIHRSTETNGFGISTATVSPENPGPVSVSRSDSEDASISAASVLASRDVERRRGGQRSAQTVTRWYSGSRSPSRREPKTSTGRFVGRTCRVKPSERSACSSPVCDRVNQRSACSSKLCSTTGIDFPSTSRSAELSVRPAPALDGFSAFSNSGSKSAKNGSSSLDSSSK